MSGFRTSVAIAVAVLALLGVGTAVSLDRTTPVAAASDPTRVPPSLYIVEVTGAFEDDDTDGVEALLVLEDPTGRIDYVPTRLPYRAALAPGTVVTGHESTGTGVYLRCALRLGGEVVSTDVGGGPANETFACLGQR